jgi:hypothetical protein
MYHASKTWKRESPVPFVIVPVPVDLDMCTVAVYEVAAAVAMLPTTLACQSTPAVAYTRQMTGSVVPLSSDTPMLNASVVTVLTVVVLTEKYHVPELV